MEQKSMEDGCKAMMNTIQHSEIAMPDSGAFDNSKVAENHIKPFILYSICTYFNLYKIKAMSYQKNSTQLIN